MTHIEGDLVIGHDASLTEHKTNFKIVLNGERLGSGNSQKKYMHNVRIFKYRNPMVTNSTGFYISFLLVTTDPSNYVGKNVVSIFKEMSPSGMLYIPASGSVILSGTCHPVYNITYNNSSNYLVVWYDINVNKQLQTDIVFECDFVTEL
jgi:hypothetical protein